MILLVVAACSAALLVGPGLATLSDVNPTRYSLVFNLYPEAAVFTGNTDINFHLLTRTRELTLNSKDLNIRRLLVYQGRTKIQIPIQYTNNDKEELVLTRPDNSEFETNSYLLRVQYRSTLKRELNGIYLTDYTTKDGEVHPIVATHFEPTHARKAFPCFDEPQLKAEFTIIIDHLVKYSVISNMPKKEDRAVRSELVRTEFLTTPAMSTYLVAFVLSDLEQTTVRTTRGVAVTVYNRPGMKQSAQAGLQTVKQSVEFFENYLGRVFPLPKLDVVPLPDFGIGGMENWGLITVREDMFYTDEDTPPDSIILMRAILAHEVAHMWFGDLVSITSWNNLWLKEGAAHMLMFPAIEHLITQNNRVTVSDIKNSLLEVSRFPALEYDSGLNTHPVSMNISDPAEAAAAFDAISYSKSAALLNMLKSVIGEDRFRVGIVKYIRDFQYGSASLSDFLKTMDTTGTVYRKMKISNFMSSWLTKSGYPIIGVTKLGKRKYRLTQSRFVNMPNFSDTETTKTRWPIMITLRTEKKHAHKFMMSSRTKIVSFNYDPGFIKINVNSTMFFRTNYDEESISGIIEQLEKHHERYFTEDDRAGLVSDILTIAMVNKCPMSYALRMMKYLPKETSYMVWDQALTKMHTLSDNLSNRTKPLFENFMSNLLTNALGKDLPDSITSFLLSNSLMYYGVLYRVTYAVENALQEFEEWEKDESQGISSVVLMYGVSELGKEELVWKKLLDTPYPGNQEFYKSLAASRDPAVITRLLEGSLKYDWVPLQNKYDILNAVSFQHPTAALKFLKDNYETFFNMYGETQFNFGNILHTVVSNQRTRADLEDAVQFFDAKNLGTGERAYRVAVGEVKSLLGWRECCEGEMREYLVNNPTP